MSAPSSPANSPNRSTKETKTKPTSDGHASPPKKPAHSSPAFSRTTQPSNVSFPLREGERVASDEICLNKPLSSSKVLTMERRPLPLTTIGSQIQNICKPQKENEDDSKTKSPREISQITAPKRGSVPSSDTQLSENFASSHHYPTLSDASSGPISWRTPRSESAYDETDVDKGDIDAKFASIASDDHDLTKVCA